jgi:hypothetical protein
VQLVAVGAAEAGVSFHGGKITRLAAAREFAYSP